MRYYVETTESVVDYIRHVDGLTPDDQLAVLDGIEVELSRDADHFLDLHPLAQESLSFRYDYFHPTLHTFFHFDFSSTRRIANWASCASPMWNVPPNR